MHITELLPISELQDLCDEFSAVTGVTTALLDLNGNVLAAAGWQDICTKFHRVNEATSARCRESDTVLASALKSGEIYNIYKCRNGLVDVAVPIVIAGRHMGNFFTGQFFLEAADQEKFRAQAREFGFPETEYMAALARAPIMTEDRIRRIMGFLTRLTKFMAEMGMARMSEEAAYQELRQSRRLLQTIIDSVPIRIFWKDREMRYMGCNPLFARDAGYESPEQMIGKNDHQMVWAESAEAYQADDRAVMESQIPKLFFEEQVLSRDGKVMWVRTSKIPLKDENAEVIGVLGLFEDITERKAAEQMLVQKNQELLRSNSDLEQFAYVSSHDLQTPLRNIVRFSQLLERRYKDRLDSDADEFIQYIVDSGKQMSSLVTDILNYSKVAGQGADLTPTSAAKAAAKAVCNLSMEIEAAQAVVEIADLPEVLAEEAFLISLFQNLVANGIRYRAEDRPARIEIKAESTGPDRVLFSVTDNGIGIAQEYHEKIFKIFEQVYTLPVRQGTGIGLSLCRRIVHKFGGDIWLRSELGKGSTFYFSLNRPES